MSGNTNTSESLRNLESLVEYLKPSLNKHGFRYESMQNGYSSRGQFANGFFVHDKIKIGLIFRNGKLGSVNYETSATNISHDMLFRALKRVSDKNLLYDDGGFNSFTLNDEDINKALLMDLENVVIPYIETTAIEDINLMMLKAIKDMWE